MLVNVHARERALPRALPRALHAAACAAARAAPEFKRHGITVCTIYFQFLDMKIRSVSCQQIHMMFVLCMII